MKLKKLGDYNAVWRPKVTPAKKTNKKTLESRRFRENQMENGFFLNGVDNWTLYK